MTEANLAAARELLAAVTNGAKVPTAADAAASVAASRKQASAARERVGHVSHSWRTKAAA